MKLCRIQERPDLRLTKVGLNGGVVLFSSGLKSGILQYLYKDRHGLITIRFCALFNRGDNFCDFLFAFLHTGPL